MQSAILEIRAGTGGEDSKLFIRDMLDMYQKYCQSHDIELSPLEVSPSVIMARIKGKIDSLSRFEPGVHRVQRVPPTESRGRRHTSTITVAVVEEKNTYIEMSSRDLSIRYYKGRGPGGQHKNKTLTGVEITHLPSGIKAACSYGRSQGKNQALAMRVLKARLEDLKERKQHDRINRKRADQIGHSGREEKIRTYNFIENRVKDERVGKAQYCLDKVMNGELDRIYRRVKV